jgi:signal transduction histidine kinase
VITILVISRNPGFLEATENQLRDENCKFACHTTFDEAKPALQGAPFDFCIVDVEHWQEAPFQQFATARQALGTCQCIAVVDSLPAEGADFAHESGVDRVVPRSLQSSMLEAIISRRSSPHPRSMSFPPSSSDFPNPTPGKRPPLQNLDILRDFSRILSHSLDLRSLVHHFVLKIREIIGVNRVAIFLEVPKSVSPSSPNEPSSRLECVCAVGIPLDVQNCVELSKRGGIGRWVTHTGQILRAEQAPALFSPSETSRVLNEFELLSCHVAVPINDRERTLGVALLGGHLTRMSFSDEELQLMFHLMEELGLSVKNSWLHSELTANHKIFSDVLDTLQSGNLVVGPHLEILHANQAIMRFLKHATRDRLPLTFAHLPKPIAERVHEVVEKGATLEPFHYQEAERSYRVSIIPFQNPDRLLPQSVMVVLEDFTEIERAKQGAIEAAGLKLTNLIAKRFAHEIRNSLVPLTTHLQLLDDQYQQPDFRDSLKSALATETSRIARFTEQMLYLAEPKFPAVAMTPVEKLLREAFSAAQESLKVQAVLTIDAPGESMPVRCHPQALRHAFQEIFLNSLQSSPKPIEVNVEITTTGQNGSQTLGIAFRDSGPGFTEETARRAMEPFYSTRNTGVGLGLTVARKIAAGLGGDLEARPRNGSCRTDLMMSLPTNKSHD